MKYNIKEDYNNQLLPVNTKYGEIIIDPNKIILCNNGLIGLADLTEFYLTDLPNNTNGIFKLLQCVNHINYSFVVLPIVCTHNNEFYEINELRALIASQNLDINNTLIAIIAKQIQKDNKLITLLNLKAPILINASNHTAHQHIFLHNKYQIEYIYNEKLIKT